MQININKHNAKCNCQPVSLFSYKRNNTQENSLIGIYWSIKLQLTQTFYYRHHLLVPDATWDEPGNQAFTHIMTCGSHSKQVLSMFSWK